jgi:SAM-dependent methyltransferase
MTGWDNPKTVRYYEAFCRRHDRYATANRDLISKAELFPGLSILDLGAGTGGTLQMLLPCIGDSGTVLCIAPAQAMREAGMSLQPDSRVSWQGSLPDGNACFDRIICSAALWQMLPLDKTFLRLRALLRTEGLLCFNIPAQYLGEPDRPGGGEDPCLIGLMVHLAQGMASKAPHGEPLPTAEEITRLLIECGFRPERWMMETRLTQEAYRDWLKIPVITDWLLGNLDPDERAERIDEAFRKVAPGSWRWEKWYGWVARV